MMNFIISNLIVGEVEIVVKVFKVLCYCVIMFMLLVGNILVIIIIF